MFGGSAFAGEKPFIVVFDLSSDNTLDAEAVANLSQSMREYLKSLARFEEIDRQAASTILSANEIDFSGCHDLTCALEAGKILGRATINIV